MRRGVTSEDPNIEALEAQQKQTAAEIQRQKASKRSGIESIQRLVDLAAVAAYVPAYSYLIENFPWCRERLDSLINSAYEMVLTDFQQGISQFLFELAVSLIPYIAINTVAYELETWLYPIDDRLNIVALDGPIRERAPMVQHLAEFMYDIADLVTTPKVQTITQWFRD